MDRTIVLTGGGTAGHIMPNIALLPELRKHFSKICYVGEKGGMEEKIARQNGLDFFSVTCVKFSRSNIMKNFAIPVKLSAGVREAKSLFARIKPDVVFSKGGFAALPAVLAAKKLKIPYVIHESDASLGLANKLTAKHASAILTAADIGVKGADTVGNPIRKEIFCGNKKNIAFKLDPKYPTLLVVGGSSGARAINEAVYRALPDLTDRYNVIHIAGKTMDTDRKAERYHQLEYTDKIADYYAAANSVVSRCGAIASEEICSLGKKALFIPLSKKASRGDQIKNAERLAAANYALVLPEENLSAGELLKQLRVLEKCEVKKRPYNMDTPAVITKKILNVINSK